jgi:hypothetical protein
MDAAIVIALIALAGSVLSTVATVFGAPALQARREGKEVLKRYEQPLLDAAYELQSRLYNILDGKFAFADTYVMGARKPRHKAAVETTLYVFAQFFGWQEIIRRDIQFLSFGRDRKTRTVEDLLTKVSETFLRDTPYGSQFMIWRVEQRGLGERMIITSDGERTCMGYATFVQKRSAMREWLQPIEEDLRHIGEGGRKRLIKLQNLLLELVWVLDPKHLHTPSSLEKIRPTSSRSKSP